MYARMRAHIIVLLSIRLSSEEMIIDVCEFLKKGIDKEYAVLQKGVTCGDSSHSHRLGELALSGHHAEKGYES